MVDSAIDTIMKGVGMLTQALEKKKEQYGEKETAADAALDAAMADRSSQQRGILERIAELEGSAAKKEAECVALAAQLTSAYGKGMNADALKLEEHLDTIQEQKNALDNKISRMREGVRQVSTSEKTIEIAKENLKALIQEGLGKRDEFIAIDNHISDVIKALEEAGRDCARTVARVSSPQFTNGRAQKLVEIVESKEGPLDVSGHHGGAEAQAKLRYVLYGANDPGLQNTPLVRGLKTNREKVVSG